ncbi:hypothetical protein [Phormidium pseudopriestleyi]|nr:hypothetical protein [Phormidium pseudopriestleyi]
MCLQLLGEYIPPLFGEAFFHRVHPACTDDPMYPARSHHGDRLL